MVEGRHSDDDGLDSLPLDAATTAPLPPQLVFRSQQSLLHPLSEPLVVLHRLTVDHLGEGGLDLLSGLV